MQRFVTSEPAWVNCSGQLRERFTLVFWDLSGLGAPARRIYIVPYCCWRPLISRGRVRWSRGKTIRVYVSAKTKRCPSFGLVFFFKFYFP